jgi:hypothetical protein
VPVLAVVPIPPPPGWALLRPDLRADYVRTLAGLGIRVNWPTK